MIKLSNLLLENEESKIYYHGTNRSSAENILSKGFSSHDKPSGMSTTTNNDFVFVTPSKQAAIWYSKTIKDDNGVIIKCKIKGSILNLKKSMPDYKAFGIVSDIFNLREKGDHYYDHHKIIQSLKENGYVGFSFFDSNASNKSVVVVIPSALTIVK